MAMLTIFELSVKIIYLCQYTQHPIVLEVYCPLMLVYNALLSHYLVLCVYIGIVSQQQLHNL